MRFVGSRTIAKLWVIVNSGRENENGEFRPWLDRAERGPPATSAHGGFGETHLHKRANPEAA
jgi:hypothetical protein